MGFLSRFTSDRKTAKEEKMRGAFYSYVKSLFPPEYYQMDFEGPNPLDVDPAPRFTAPQFHYVHQVSGARVGVLCRYFTEIAGETDMVKMVDPVTLGDMHNYHAGGSRLYLIVGIGHTPSNPDHLCLIPLFHVKPIMSKAELLRFQRNKKEIFGCFMGKLT